MAINRKRADVGYGLTNPLQDLAPEPIAAQRAPTTQDFALPGTVWLDQSVGQDIYLLLQVAANVATWLNVSGAGVGAITTVNGGTNINVTGAAPVVTVNVDDAPTFAGLVTGEAGLTIEAGTISLTSDTNGPGAITLEATIGGIDITAPGAAAGEDIDITTSASINLVSSEAVDNAISLDASDAAGGIDLVTGGGEISLDTTDGNIQLAPGTNSVAGDALTLDAKVGAATFTGLATGSGDFETLVITNSNVTTASSIIVGLMDGGSTATTFRILRVRAAAGSFSAFIENTSGAILNGDLILSFIVLN